MQKQITPESRFLWCDIFNVMKENGSEKIPEKEKFPTAAEMLQNLLRVWEDCRLYTTYFIRRTNYLSGHRYDPKLEASQMVWQQLRQVALDTHVGQGPPLLEYKL